MESQTSYLIRFLPEKSVPSDSVIKAFLDGKDIETISSTFVSL